MPRHGSRVALVLTGLLLAACQGSTVSVDA
jgi:hypothetical protein